MVTMRSLQLISVMDAVIMYGAVRFVWYLIALVYRFAHRDYERQRDRVESIRKHYIENHDTPLRECRDNLCATVI